MVDTLTLPQDISALFFCHHALIDEWKSLLVSGFMGDCECQTQACVLINGTAPVLAAHPTNWSKACKTSDTILQILHQTSIISSVVTHLVPTQTVIDVNNHCQTVFTPT